MMFGSLSVVKGEDGEAKRVEVAREGDTGDDSLFLQGGLYRLPQLPVRANERAKTLPIIESSGKDQSEVLEVLLPAQWAEVADEGGRDDRGDDRGSRNRGSDGGH